MTLESRRICKSFAVEGGILRRRVGAIQALSEVSFKVNRGETVAFVGGSGCGKSTMAKIIAGLVEPDRGEILWDGQSLRSIPRQKRGRLVQMVFQDPFASLNPKLSVETQLVEVIHLKREGISAQAARTRAKELLGATKLPEEALRYYPFQFSGGQRQRIALARSLAMEPELLVADEPLSALDVTIQAQILELFRTLKAQLNLALLFITHDLAVINNFADRVFIMKDGQIIEEGATASLFAQPTQAYTKALLDAVPRLPS